MSEEWAAVAQQAERALREVTQDRDALHRLARDVTESRDRIASERDAL